MTAATILGFAGLALFVTTTMVWFTRANKVAIPDNRLLFLAGWAGAALLGITSLSASSANWLSYVLGGLALLGGVFLLGLYSLGKQKAVNLIAVGDTFPIFTATDDHGQTYTSEALMGKPTLIKFFRGHW